MFFFQARKGIRDLVRSRGLGEVYKRRYKSCILLNMFLYILHTTWYTICLLYTFDAAAEKTGSYTAGSLTLIKN